MLSDYRDLSLEEMLNLLDIQKRIPPGRFVTEWEQTVWDTQQAILNAFRLSPEDISQVIQEGGTF